jgi:hypothetical protein
VKSYGGSRYREPFQQGGADCLKMLCRDRTGSNLQHPDSPDHLVLAGPPISDEFLQELLQRFQFFS